MCKDNHISLAAGGEQHKGEDVSFIQIQFPNHKFQMIAKFQFSMTKTSDDIDLN
jgi:hypothetical protein